MWQVYSLELVVEEQVRLGQLEIAQVQLGNDSVPQTVG